MLSRLSHRPRLSTYLPSRRLSGAGSFSILEPEKKSEKNHAAIFLGWSCRALAGALFGCAGRWLVRHLGVLRWLLCGGPAQGREDDPQSVAVAMAAALALCWTLLSVPAYAQSPTGVLRVVDATWHDADTATITVAGPWGHGPVAQPCRALGYDAWEVSKTRQTIQVTDDEVARGKAAVTALTAWLDGAELYVIPPAAGRDRDAYGRMLGEFWTRKAGRTPQWMSLAEWVRSHDYDRAVGIDGKPRPK